MLLPVLILVLVVFASTLALAEASLSRLTPVRARVLREQGHRNGERLEAITRDPARALNAIYLAVLLSQNGSAILLAILAQKYLGEIGITVASIAFTLAYFVVVEAMCKTFAILHSDRVALLVTPLVWLLARLLAWPTRALIGLSNVLLPGKGLKQGPFAYESDIRSLAETAFEEGEIAEHEKKMIHSVFQFGDRVVREVMKRRPDIVAIETSSSIDDAVALFIEHGLSRIPAYSGDLDHTDGLLFIEDVLHLVHEQHGQGTLSSLLRPVRFVPESMPAADLLRHMQEDKFHLAMVSDEYGSISGLVTIENLVEQLVGGTVDERSTDLPDVVVLAPGRYRVDAALPITDLSVTLHEDLPHDRWNTVGGLIFGLLGRIPSEGDCVELNCHRFTAERIQGRRIVSVLVERQAPPTVDPPAD